MTPIDYGPCTIDVWARGQAYACQGVVVNQHGVAVAMGRLRPYGYVHVAARDARTLATDLGITIVAEER